MLRGHNKAVITFQQPVKKLRRTDTSIHRMPGPRGDPRAGTIQEIPKLLRTNERAKLRVEAHRAAAQRDAKN